jgi:hypothetical protein
MDRQKTPRLVLGEGETIGHKHVLESKTGIEYARDGAKIAMRINDTAVLTHDEHGLMVFSIGRYRSYRQVELNPMTNEVLSVFD